MCCETMSESCAGDSLSDVTASSRIGSDELLNFSTVGGVRSVGMYTRAVSTRRCTSIVS